MKGCQLTAICSLMNDHSTGLPLGSCWCYLYSTVSDLPVLVKTASTRLINTEFLRQICTRVESCCVVMLMTDTNMNERVFLSASLTSKELSIIPKRAPLPVFNALGLRCQPYEWCKSLLTLIPSVQAVCKQCCYAILPAVEKTRYFTWNLFVMILFFAPSVVIYCHQVSVMFYCCLCRPYTMKKVKFKKDVLKTWRMSDYLSCLKTDGQRVTELLI